MSEEVRAHWSGMARIWSQVGPPLKPVAEDLRVVHRLLQGRPAGRPPRVLVLGVTAEYYLAAVPYTADIAAVDRSQAMIDAFWPGPAGSAICGEWGDLPLPAGSRDVVLCDGGFSMVSFPHGLSEVARSISRVTEPGGYCVARLYVRPTPPEAPAKVLEDFSAGRIPDLNHLKLRLWTSLQEEPTRGTAVRDVWKAVMSLGGDADQIARVAQWDPVRLAPLEAYRASDARYWFPDLDEVVALFSGGPEGFELVSVTVPRYALGDRCPTIVLRRTASFS